jgi:hypothetical protein
VNLWKRPDGSHYEADAAASPDDIEVEPTKQEDSGFGKKPVQEKEDGI